MAARVEFTYLFSRINGLRIKYLGSVFQNTTSECFLVSGTVAIGYRVIYAHRFYEEPLMSKPLLRFTFFIVLKTAKSALLNISHGLDLKTSHMILY